jgi:hypothetical protein
MLIAYYNLEDPQINYASLSESLSLSEDKFQIRQTLVSKFELKYSLYIKRDYYIR